VQEEFLIKESSYDEGLEGKYEKVK